MFARLATATVFLSAAVSAAQTQAVNSTLRPITSEVKHAGTFHVSTGAWSRGASSVALAGPEVIYDNTCTSGYYAAFPPGTKVMDSGRIPSTTSPSNMESLTGLYDLYEVNGFEIAYCSAVPLSVNMDLSFSDCYAACDGGGDFAAPIAVLNLVNMPAATATGAPGCWVVMVDLTNTSLIFNLGGDCDGIFDDVPSMDGFGWNWTETAPATGLTGPMLAGDPNGLFPQSGQPCGGFGAGTTFPSAGVGPGQGIGIIDQFEFDVPNLYGGCSWFGGYAGQNPYASFYLKLQGDQGTPCSNNGSAYCAGDGTGAACPCANTGGAGEGCANSTGVGAVLTAVGCADVYADSLQFDISGVAGSKPGILFRGNSQINGGNGNPVGGGLVCVAGGTQRSQVQVTTAGGTSFTDWNGVGFGSVSSLGSPTNFQFWYRDAQGGSCGSGFNFSNAWTVTYTP